MKKLLVATNILFLSIILFQVSSQNEKPNKAAIYNPLDTCNPCVGRPCRGYSDIPLTGMINGQVAKSMSLAYSNDEGKAFITRTARPRRQDALSISFELEKIKNFIWHIEHSVCESGCDTVQLGIRIYYAKYPSTVGTKLAPRDLIGIPKNYANKHTVFMSGIYKKGNKWLDFDHEQMGENCSFNPIQDSLNMFRLFALIENIGDGENHGGLAPPPSPGTFPTNY